MYNICTHGLSLSSPPDPSTLPFPDVPDWQHPSPQPVLAAAGGRVETYQSLFMGHPHAIRYMYMTDTVGAGF